MSNAGILKAFVAVVMAACVLIAAASCGGEISVITTQNAAGSVQEQPVSSARPASIYPQSMSTVADPAATAEPADDPEIESVLDDPELIAKPENAPQEDPEYNKKPVEITPDDTISGVPALRPDTGNQTTTTTTTTTTTASTTGGNSTSNTTNTTTTTPTTAPHPANGWFTADGKTYLYYNNTPVTGHQSIDGVRYYFDKKGVLSSYVGIDVSYSQGNIDWNAVKAAGIDFAIIRVGFRGYGKEGNMRIDEYFERNIKGATAAGIDCGVYFYTQAITVQEAIEEAELTLKAIKGFTLTYPIFFDTELCYADASLNPNPVARANNSNISSQLRTDMAIAFCDTIKAAGYYPGIYASASWINDVLQPSRLKGKYDLWVAHWTSGVTSFSPYTIWQYTETGRVDGISNAVDRNLGMFDYATYIRRNGYNHLS